MSFIENEWKTLPLYMSEKIKNFKNLLISFLIEKPYLSFLFGVLPFVLVAPFISQIEMDFSAQSWFEEDDSYILQLKEFERTFGSDEQVVIVLELDEPRVFTPEIVEAIHEITESLWLVPQVVRVESLTNYYWSYADGDDIITEPFLPDDQLSDSIFLKERQKEALEHKVINGVYVSQDLKSALIYGRIALSPTSTSDFERISHAVKELVEKYNDDQRFTLHQLGEPILSESFQSISFRDLSVMAPFLIIFILIYLTVIFKTAIGVLIPMVVIVFSTGFTMGITGLWGVKVNTLTFVLPSVLIAISIADSVHLMTTFFGNYFKGQHIKESLRLSLDKNIYPIFLTSISTGIGFLSLKSSHVVPVADLGVLAAIGTMSAMYFTFFLCPPLLMWTLKNHYQHSSQDRQLLVSKEFIHSYLEVVDRFKVAIITLSFGLIVTFGYFAIKNQVDSNPYDYFKSSHPISKANQFILKAFGGVSGPEIIIDSGESNGIKDPDFLRLVEEFQEWIISQNYVNNVMSIVDIVKEMNQALFGGDPDEFRIHEKRDVIAQEIFLYTLSLPQGMGLHHLVDMEDRKIRLSILWELQSSSESLKKIKVIEDKAKELGLNIQVTGKAILFQRMNDYVVSTFFTSISMALVLITFILIFVFKSLKVGLLSLVPNFVPIIMGAGFLTILGVPIDIGCAIVASVTLGIAVDDTIHFLTHYNKLLKMGLSRFDALVEVISTTGMALLVTTLILVSCFGVFIFASLTPNINFGLLCGFVISLALICDFLIIPALVLLKKEAPKGIEG